MKDRTADRNRKRATQLLRKNGYASGGVVRDPPGASTQRREAEPAAKYAKGGGVHRKGGTQVNIIVPSHPGGAPMGGPPIMPHPSMVAAPPNPGLVPHPPMAGPPGAPMAPPMGPMHRTGGRVR